MLSIGGLSIENMNGFLRWYVIVGVVVDVIALIEIFRIEKEINNGETFRRK